MYSEKLVKLCCLQSALLWSMGMRRQVRAKVQVSGLQDFSGALEKA